jgi:hypothetical protein
VTSLLCWKRSSAKSPKRCTVKELSFRRKLQSTTIHSHAFACWIARNRAASERSRKIADWYQRLFFAVGVALSGMAKLHIRHRREFRLILKSITPCNRGTSDERPQKPRGPSGRRIDGYQLDPGRVIVCAIRLLPDRRAGALESLPLFQIRNNFSKNAPIWKSGAGLILAAAFGVEKIWFAVLRREAAALASGRCRELESRDPETDCVVAGAPCCRLRRLEGDATSHVQVAIGVRSIPPRGSYGLQTSSRKEIGDGGAGRARRHWPAGVLMMHMPEQRAALPFVAWLHPARLCRHAAGRASGGSRPPLASAAWPSPECRILNPFSRLTKISAL